MIFPSRRKIISGHGCFWHQHQGPACTIAHQTRSNLAPAPEAKLPRSQALDLIPCSALQMAPGSNLEGGLVRGGRSWKFLLDCNEDRPHDSLGDLKPSEYLINYAGNSTFKWST